VALSVEHERPRRHHQAGPAALVGGPGPLIGMHVLAVIPARAGSKGIPGKNIRPLNGRPLLAYSVDAARESRTVTRVVVSTDDEEIARVAREAGAEVPFLRPAALAGDAVPMLDTLQQVVAALKSA